MSVSAGEWTVEREFLQFDRDRRIVRVYMLGALRYKRAHGVETREPYREARFLLRTFARVDRPRALVIVHMRREGPRK